MPFSAPTTLTINVTQADIDAATADAFNNSLCKAMQRLGKAKQLPGQAEDLSIQDCSFYAQVSPIMTGNGVSLASVLVCSDVYGCDLNSALVIGSENLGIKPAVPYTVSLYKGI